MHNKRVYDVSIAIERIKNYCALQDRCQWDVLKKIREVCNISIEEKRANKEIGSSLEANLIISLDDKKTSIVQDIDFSELCITSSATLEKNTSEEILVKTTKAEGNKCPRCWKIFQTSCKRCENAKIN